MKAELVLDARAQLGEGLLWDVDTQLLYWIDIPGQKLHRFNPADGSNSSMDVGQQIGCISLCEEGGLIAGMTDGIYEIDFEGQIMKCVYQPAQGMEGLRFNDGKCDASGRFMLGTMGIAGQKELVGSFYRYDGVKGTLDELLHPVYISNGLAWTEDNRTMYYSDTTRTLWAFDYDVQNSAISNRRAIATIPEGEGFSDGLTIDEEGMLWVAQYNGGCVGRYNPHTGEKIDEVSVGAHSATCCAFGGKDMDELYITTVAARADTQKYPYAGGLFMVKPGVRGRVAYKFKK